ncbi:thiopeptide-type bacteriocin biosynthesis protein [Streptomyces sp. NPDC086182]|uniref:thiopeptide-type bacteriocin biosynthesis protein n=1 Tax=Streptomyces sp. NPDC086182 TaxID=3155058 RepID=UPI003443C82B
MDHPPHDEEELPHTELTIRLSDPSQAADAIRALGGWADHLIDTGVISDTALVPYRPHVGLWGSRRTLTAAEEVWAADSGVIAYQQARMRTLAPQSVLAAANLVAIRTGFHQDVTDGMRWLAAQPKPSSADRIPTLLLQQARELIVPGDWARLRRTPASRVLVDECWAARHAALNEQRAALDPAPHIDADAVLRALLTTHLRLAGEAPDGTAWRLARAVALARTRPRRQTT